MKNASIEDVDRAKETGKLEENVMYREGMLLVHGKCLSRGVQQLRPNPSYVFAESNKGEIVVVNLNWLLPPVKKGPANQPKKPRHKHTKGTKPETKIHMSADVKLNVGDRVELKNGVRTKVVEVDSSDVPYRLEYEYLWCMPSGQNIEYAQYGDKGYEQFSIAYKIIPYQEPAKEAKTPEQEAFEKGYWIANNGVMPGFVRNVRVEVLFSHGETSDRLGHMYYYRGDPSSTYYIVAYRKAK